MERVGMNTVVTVPNAEKSSVGLRITPTLERVQRKWRIKGVSKMKVCPYCGKDVGDEIWDTDYSIYDCGKCEENEYSYMDYIVECPNCNGGFHWIEICKRINTVIQNSDTGELTQYKE